MNSVYPNVAEVKLSLQELSHILPEIAGRGEKENVSTFGKTESLPTRGKINPDSIFAIDERILNFTEWFIETAHEYSELPPSRVRGYIGRIGISGQMLDYMHTDPIAERITSAISNKDLNPSTLTMPITSYYDPISKLQLKYLDKPTSSVPVELLNPQEPEGGITLFVLNQLHGEAPLPVGTSKIFLSADFKY